MLCSQTVHIEYITLHPVDQANKAQGSCGPAFSESLPGAGLPPARFISTQSEDLILDVDVGYRRGGESFLYCLSTFLCSLHQLAHPFNLLCLQITWNHPHPTILSIFMAIFFDFRISSFHGFPWLCPLEEKAHQNRDMDTILDYAFHLLHKCEKFLNVSDPWVPALYTRIITIMPVTWWCQLEGQKNVKMSFEDHKGSTKLLHGVLIKCLPLFKFNNSKLAFKAACLVNKWVWI